MPFTSGGQTYRGGDYLFSGLSGLGKGVESAIEKYDNLKQDEKTSDVLFKNWLDSQALDKEAKAAKQHEYYSLSPRDKKGYAAGIAEAFSMQYKHEALQSLIEQRQAAAEERLQRAAALNWTPDEAAKQVARWTNNELTQVGPGKFQLVPYGDTADTGQVQAKRLTIGDKEVPGWLVVSKPGSNQFQVLPEGAGGLVQDPNTKAWGVLGPRKNFVPLTSQQFEAMNMSGVQLPSTQPAAKPADQPSAPSSPLDAIRNFLIKSGLGKSLQGAAAPTPTPGAMPSPVAGIGDAGQPSDSGQPGSVIAARQQAIQILQQNGKAVSEANIQFVLKQIGASQ